MLTSFQTTGQRPRLPFRQTAWGPGRPAEPVLASLGRPGLMIHAERDEEIVAQGDTAEYCYLITSGCIRTVKLLEDGRRQIGEFFFSGDLFGWEALGEHDFGAEAVTPATFCRYSRRSLDALADQDHDFARRMLRLTAGQFRAGRKHMVLLGRKTASERVASFLLEMVERMNADGQALIELPMGRADIADYLGLTIETVCRVLTQFRQRGTIAVERSRIIIRDRHALGVAGCELLH